MGKEERVTDELERAEEEQERLKKEWEEAYNRCIDLRRQSSD